MNRPTSWGRCNISAFVPASSCVIHSPGSGGRLRRFHPRPAQPTARGPPSTAGRRPSPDRSGGYARDNGNRWVYFRLLAAMAPCGLMIHDPLELDPPVVLKVYWMQISKIGAKGHSCGGSHTGLGVVRRTENESMIQALGVSSKTELWLVSESYRPRRRWIGKYTESCFKSWTCI